MKEPISGETLFEEPIKQIEWNQEAVAVQNPYTPAHIFSLAYTNIKKCKQYQDDCQEWSWKPIREKPWSNFKAHLTRAFNKTRISSRTSKTEGNVANVYITQANAALFTKMQQYHTLALANLSTKTQANITLVTMVTKTISELSSQVATLTAKLATAQFENTHLKKSGPRLIPVEHSHQASRNPTQSYQNSIQE